MSKLKRMVWVGLLIGYSTSCNQFIDRQPPPDQGPPSVGVQALIRQYAQAQDTRFTTIANNQLWQADFTHITHRYRALISPDQLLTADQLWDVALPDSLTRLLAQTVVAGGTFSNPRQRRYDRFRSQAATEQTLLVYADYTWQQQSYTTQWTITRLTTGQVLYQTELLPYQQTEYQTNTPTDLPEPLQAVLRQQGLTFTYAVIQVDALRHRRFMVSVRQQNQYWQLTYDEAGQLLAVSNPQTAIFFQQLGELPLAIQQYLQRPELVGFGLGANALSLHTYGSMGTYRVNLQKDKQRWLLVFSDKSQLVSRSFLTYQ